jgi:acyl-CoA thioesterase
MMQDAAKIARRSAQALWAQDKASEGLGMQVLEVAPGRAKLAMIVTERMVNGHGRGHGGFIFTLADSALAFACNSYGFRSVAQHCTITYLNPAQLGMRLLAEANERHRSDRGGIYDVSVRDESGTLIAEFRGHSRRLPEPLFDASP